ncbi:MAG: HAMP domain-containing protein [Proteobacteria bacterium]|nr:HAMP domain-containing protein [Pseudomonadota bacterium]
MSALSTRIFKGKNRWATVIGILVFIGLVLFFSGRYRSLKEMDPSGVNLFVYFLVNLNVLLLTVLLFLLGRNTVKLFYEGKKRVFGYHLRARLVLIFVGFSLIPTILLFFVARGFITDSIDYWFHLDVDKAVEGSLSVSQDYYSTMASLNRVFAQRVSDRMGVIPEGGAVENALEELRRDYGLSMIEIFDPEGSYRGRAWDGTSPQMFLDGQNSLVQNALMGRVVDGISRAGKGEFVRASAPLRFSGGQGAVVVSMYLTEEVRQKAEDVGRIFRGYTEMKLQEKPIMDNYMAYLLFITLLILFSAVWLGFYIARGITVPIGLLAEGAEKVAEGDLTVRIETAATDEIGILVKAFNKMTGKLEKTTRDLEKASRENEQRRAYIETVLRNVGTGVVSMDLAGRINTFNRAAEKMFNVRGEEILGRHYTKVLTPEHSALLERILADLGREGGNRVRREFPVAVQGKPLLLFITASVMEEPAGRGIGTVLVIEDMTMLVNAQRKAAWSEAAKRIAHEIKNPLTPIKLSAERMRRKLAGSLDGEEGKVLIDGTDSIMREVDAMRNLVDEFSRFARLPVLKPVPGKINAVVQEVAALFQGEREKGGEIRLSLADDLPRISFDAEQIRRVIINLLDNALKAVQDRGSEGVVAVSTRYLEQDGLVAIAVSDNGSGIPEDLLDRIFDPYFSTREGGIGLGLAISQRIIEEHGGTIECTSSPGEGTVFTVRLPVDIDPLRRV